jgi:hypothetical protein
VFEEELVTESLEHESYEQNDDVIPESIEEYEDNGCRASIDTAIERLRDIVKLNNNSATEERVRISKFDHIRYLCILRFLESIKKNPRSRVESSREIAKAVYGLEKGGEYKSWCIRMWSNEIMQNRLLMPLRQGKHQKAESYLMIQMSNKSLSNTSVVNEQN